MGKDKPWGQASKPGLGSQLDTTRSGGLLGFLLLAVLGGLDLLPSGSANGASLPQDPAQGL